MRFTRWGLLGFLLVAPFAQACINAVATDHESRRFYFGDLDGPELLRRMAWGEASHCNWIRASSGAIVKKARSAPGFEQWNDLGALLICQGQHKRAIDFFLFLEKRYPGRAATAANLGTALELAGHDHAALRWIRLGIRRNPDEHLGTEWLHVRILQAKLDAERHPEWLRTRSIAGVAFDATVVPRVPGSMPSGNRGAPVKPWELRDALRYQLEERMGFVKPQDPVVANLLHDWATLHLAGGSMETAGAAYEHALRHGWPSDGLLEARRARIRKVLANVDPQSDPDVGGCGICRPYK